MDSPNATPINLSNATPIKLAGMRRMQIKGYCLTTSQTTEPLLHSRAELTG